MTVHLIIICVMIIVGFVMFGAVAYSSGYNTGHEKSSLVSNAKPLNCCEVCGSKLEIHAGNVYSVKEEKELFDAIDCPVCGCQKVLKRRLQEEPIVRHNEDKIQIIDLSR